MIQTTEEYRPDGDKECHSIMQPLRKTEQAQNLHKIRDNMKPIDNNRLDNQALQ
jgi:hypothetical protein